MNAKANRPYKVSVSSGNVGAAVCASPCFYSTSTLEGLPFSLYRDGNVLTFSAGTGAFINKGTRSAGSGDNYAIQITYHGTGVSLAEGSNYEEVFTFTIGVP